MVNVSTPDLIKASQTGYIIVKLEDLDDHEREMLLKNPTEAIEKIRDDITARIGALTGNPRRVQVYLSGLETPTKAFNPRDVGAELAGQLIPVIGLVKKVSQTHDLVPAKLVYKCGNNTLVFEVDPDAVLSEGRVPRPTQRMLEDEEEPCNSPSAWAVDVRSSELLDLVRIELEDLSERLPTATIPKSVQVYFYGTYPREKIKVGQKLLAYALVNAVQRRGGIWRLVLKGVGFDIINAEEDWVKVDTNRVKQMVQDSQWYHKAVMSFAHSIWGQWDLKEAMLLAALGGSDEETVDGIRIRGRFHVLAITEPGIGKSDMVEYLKKVHPRVVYAVGMGSTGVGLTVALNRTASGWEIQAGAVVLASGGIAVIDEIDKLSPDDRQYLHEVMEQQRITVNKAGVTATIHTPVTIIGLGNPKKSRYDPSLTVAENLDLPPSVLSRFALVFVIRQTTDPEEAKAIARWIWLRKKIQPPVSADDMKQFIAYARKLKPKMTPEAYRILESFYIKMVEGTKKFEEQTGQPAPLQMTPRQLLDLRRLSQAYAKLFLSRKVTPFHAKLAIRLMYQSLATVGLSEETGLIDIGKVVGLIPIDRERVKAEWFEHILKLAEKDLAEVGSAEISLDEAIPPELDQKLKKVGIKGKEARKRIIAKELKEFAAKQGLKIRVRIRGNIIEISEV